MKVLLITKSINEKIGWGRHALAIAEHLRGQGAKVTLYVEQHGRASFLRNSIGVRRLAREHDVVHAMDGWPLGVWGYLAVVGRPIPLFINGVGTYSIAPLYSLWKGFLLRRAYGKAKKIFCISDYTGKELLSAGVPAEKIMTVHFGVPALPLVPLPEQESYRKKYAIPADAFPIILTVGSIKERKGQMETLKAVEILKQRYPHILYVMAGSSNHPQYVAGLNTYAIEHGLAEHIRIVTGADDRELSFLYSVCTLFALSSNNNLIDHHFEGFGAVILEACQFGKPSVGSSGCGIEDAIADGQSGLLTWQKDPEDIAEKIEQILEQLDFFSRNAALRYTLFDWRKTVSAYLKSYAS